MEAAAVTANFLSTLGVTPMLGRAFPGDADTAGRAGAAGSATDRMRRHVTGVGLAIVLIRLSGGALLGVPSLDARVTLIVVAAAIVLTIAGSLEPARHAARVDVAELLRSEY